MVDFLLLLESLLSMKPKLSAVTSIVAEFRVFKSVPPVAVLANSIVSFVALVVILMPLPALKVSVSAAASATTSDCPEVPVTAIVLNASVTVPPLSSATSNFPMEELYFNILLFATLVRSTSTRASIEKFVKFLVLKFTALPINA